MSKRYPGDAAPCRDGPHGLEPVTAQPHGMHGLFPDLPPEMLKDLQQLQDSEGRASRRGSRVTPLGSCPSS